MSAAIAVAAKEALDPSFKVYAQNVVDNAKALGAALIERGFSVISGGTDNHILLLDVTTKGLSGKQAAQALDKAGIVLNYNAIPFDTRKPFDPSGVRIGTPALTSRGFDADDFDRVAELIVDVLANTSAGTTKAGEPSKASYVLGDGVADRVTKQSAEMLDKHPLYPGLELT